MIKYKVIQSKTIQELEECITVMLNDGWQCQGGIEITFWNREIVYGFYYSQAMILEKITTKEMII